MSVLAQSLAPLVERGLPKSPTGIKIIGDLSQTDRVLVGLDVQPRAR